jgi:hypothetical protein
VDDFFSDSGALILRIIQRKNFSISLSFIKNQILVTAEILFLKETLAFDPIFKKQLFLNRKHNLK